MPSLSSFVAGSLVLTQEGYVPIESVEITDSVYTHKGRFCHVTNLGRKMGQTIRLVELAIHHRPLSIHTTEDQLFLARSQGKSKARWIPASCLGPDHYIGIPINMKSISPTDEQVIWLRETEGIRNFTEPIPEWLHNAPPEFIDEFLRRSRAILATVKSHAIALDLQRLFLKVGYICSVAYNPKTVDYSILWAQKDAFFDGAYAWFRVIGLKPVSSYTYLYSLEVAEDHSYCVENAAVSE